MCTSQSCTAAWLQPTWPKSRALTHTHPWWAWPQVVDLQAEAGTSLKFEAIKEAVETHKPAVLFLCQVHAAAPWPLREAVGCFVEAVGLWFGVREVGSSGPLPWALVGGRGRQLCWTAVHVKAWAG